MKPLVIYHANCADGFGAAFAAWLKLGDDAEYVPMQYLDAKLNAVEAWEALSAAIPSRANTGREVYILDFSLPKPVMDKLFAVSERVVWLDHHKTAFEMWCDYPFLKGNHHCDVRHQGKHYIELNDNKSGAMLAWEYFHPDTEVPMFIQHIDDRDRWQFKLPGSRELNAAIWSSSPWSFEGWYSKLGKFENQKRTGHFHDNIEHGPLADMYTEGAAILRAHEQNVQAVVKGAGRKCEVPVLLSTALSTSPIVGLSANCPPHLTSDVGHELATQSGTFGLCWYLGREGTTAKCSLRSNGEYDVSAIAKVFGGGGHRNAAGFEVEISTLLSWLK